MYGSAAETIISAHDTSQPLFLYVALQNVHTPLEAPTEYLSQYNTAGLTYARKKASGKLIHTWPMKQTFCPFMEQNADFQEGISQA